MSRFAFAVVIGLLALSPAVAEDWTGKKVKAKDDVKPGKRDGAGLIRGGDVVKKGTELTVKADDGTFLELDGKLGTIFKAEAVLVSTDPDALPSDGLVWEKGTWVFIRDNSGQARCERRAPGLPWSLRLHWTMIPSQVRKDLGDGTVLLVGQGDEWRVEKRGLAPLADVPVWAERRLNSNPDDAYAHRGLALLYSQGKHAEAEREYTTALKIQPDNHNLYFERGVARSYQQHYGAAAADFTECVVRRPNDAAGYVWRGQALLHLKRWAHAERDMTAALRIEPKNRLALACRAVANLNRGELVNCLADAEQVPEDDPNYFMALASMGGAYARQGKYQEAKDCFERGVARQDVLSSFQVEYARFLSTCADERFRDGVKARVLARWVRRGFLDRKWPMPADHYEVLAASCAEAAFFEEAVEFQSEAITKLKADEDTSAAELKRAEKVLELYEKKKPLRDE